MQKTKMTDQQRADLSASLQNLARWYREADYGSDIGGAKEMCRLADRAREVMKAAGLDPGAIINAEFLERWAAEIAAGSFEGKPI